MCFISEKDFDYLLPDLMKRSDSEEKTSVLLIGFQVGKLIEYQENLIDYQEMTMKLYEELRADLQEIKKALAPMGDNPDRERKEKPDNECPVKE